MNVQAIRRIVEEKQAGRVDGVRLDLFSASAILTVHDKLSECNRARYAKMEVRRAAVLAFKLVR